MTEELRRIGIIQDWADQRGYTLKITGNPEDDESSDLQDRPKIWVNPEQIANLHDFQGFLNRVDQIIGQGHSSDRGEA